MGVPARQSLVQEQWAQWATCPAPSQLNGDEADQLICFLFVQGHDKGVVRGHRQAALPIRLADC